MPIFRVLPAIVAVVLLAAHFYRAGWVFLAPLCIGLAALLFVRFAWVPRVVALALGLGAAEWLRVLASLAAERVASGEPWARLVAILLAVAMATLLAALPLRSSAVRRWYQEPSEPTGP